MAVRKPLVLVAGQIQQLQAGDTIPSTAMATATATIDCGTSSDLTTIEVARTEITGTSAIMANLAPVATSDHTIDEHLVDGPLIVAHSPVAGVGFSVSAIPRPGHGPTSGLWTFRWWSTD
jgi:hypothetical protein